MTATQTATRPKINKSYPHTDAIEIPNSLIGNVYRARVSLPAGTLIHPRVVEAALKVKAEADESMRLRTERDQLDAKLARLDQDQAARMRAGTLSDEEAADEIEQSTRSMRVAGNRLTASQAAVSEAYSGLLAVVNEVRNEWLAYLASVQGAVTERALDAISAATDAVSALDDRGGLIRLLTAESVENGIAVPVERVRPGHPGLAFHTETTRQQLATLAAFIEGKLE
jgi:hypothetical protein